MDNGEGKESNRKQDVRDIPITWRYWVNLATTIGLLVLMFLDKVPGYFVFMMGLSIALVVNYKETKTQISKVKEYGADAVYIVAIMLCSGVLVGVMKGTGMLDAMAMAIVNIIPQGIKNLYGVLIGYLSIPLSICLGADGFYYGLAPLFTQVGAEYGFAAAVIGAIMIMARDAFGNITPVSPVTYLAPGMLGKDLGAFIKFSFPKLLLFFKARPGRIIFPIRKTALQNPFNCIPVFLRHFILLQHDNT
jgi:CitMHS family citrate-Mg2+:H+ or citrate-Ca2+:H+ symporter